MAKQSNGKPIIVNINGQNRPFQEEPAKIAAETADHPEPEPLKPPVPLPKTKNHDETAAAKELSDESFDWVLPETETTQAASSNFSHSSQPQKKFPSQSMLKSILLSVIFAIVIGTSLGVIMLKLVINNDGKPNSADSSSAVNTMHEENKAPGPSAEKNQTLAVLKSMSSFVIQGGVFTTKEAAGKAVKQATNKGIPAADFVINGQHYLFLGVAESKEDARSLSALYKSADGAFSKPFVIEEKKRNITKKEQLFLTKASSLFQILTKLTANLELAKSDKKQISSSITLLEKEIKKIDNKELADKKIIKLKAEILSAAEQAKVYVNKGGQSRQLQAQQHLLAYFSVYHEW